MSLVIPQWLTDPGFLGVLLASATFYRTVLTPLLLALLLPIIGLLTLWRVRRPHSPTRLHGDQRGSAMAVDAILTMPFFLAIVMLVIQFMILANAALITHYAAYSAARSARVWANSLDPPSDADILDRAEMAARLALVAASPTNPDLPIRALQPFPNSLFSAIAEAHGQPERREVFLNRARYAFDRDNVTVALDYDGPRQVAYAVFAQPVRARVTYEVYLNLPFGWILASDRGDGVRTRTVSAEMELL